MAKLLSLAGIQTGLPVEAHHVSQSIRAFRGLDAYDITVSGSMTINGITYPYVDGASGSVLMTDGAGNATFQPVFTSASYISSSNVDGPYGMDSIQSASWAATASYAQFAQNASASLVSLRSLSTDNAISASYALTASYVEKVNSEKFCFVNQTTVVVTHGIGSESVVVQAYEESATGELTLTIPDSTVINNKDQVTVTFAVPTTGCITISGGGFLRSGSIQNAQSASYVERLNHALTNGFGIQTLSFDGSEAQVVSIDPTTILNTASFAFTAAYAENAGGFDKAVITSSISGFTQSFERGDGTTYENYINSASYALTASYIDLAETKRFDFTAQQITIPHNLDTENVLVQVYESGSPYYKKVIPTGIEIVDRDNVRLTFTSTTEGYVIIGQSGFIREGVVATASLAFEALNADTASFTLKAGTADSLNHTLSNGLGIESFTYNGTADRIVTLDTSSTHFTDGVDKARAADTGSFYVNSYIAGNVITFERGDGTFHNQTIVSSSYAVSSSHSEFADSSSYAVTSSHAITASYALTASFIEGTRAVIPVASGTGTTFNIAHNLKVGFPIIQSYNASKEQVIPDNVKIIDNNNIQVTFAGAFTGNIVVQK